MPASSEEFAHHANIDKLKYLLETVAPCDAERRQTLLRLLLEEVDRGKLNGWISRL